MATKKQKRLAGMQKYEEEMAALRASGLKAQQKAREIRQAKRERRESDEQRAQRRAQAVSATAKLRGAG
jgi:hypothetical protein